MEQPTGTTTERQGTRPPRFRLSISMTLVILFVLIVFSSQLAFFLSSRKMLTSAVHEQEIAKINSIGIALDNFIKLHTSHVAQIARFLVREEELQHQLQHWTPQSERAIANALDHADDIAKLDMLEVTNTLEAIVYNDLNPARSGQLSTLWGVSEALSGKEMLTSFADEQGISICAIEPVRAEKEIVGTLVAGVRLDDAFIRKLGQEVGANLALLSRTGRHIGASWVVRNIDHKAVQEAFYQKIPIYRNDAAERYTRVYLPFFIVDEAFVLLVQIDSSEAYWKLESNQQQSAITAFIILVAGILLGFVSLRYVLRPLRHLRDSAEQTAVQFTGSAIASHSNDDVMAVVEVMETLTTRLVRQNTELAAMNSRLRELDHMKSEFVTSVSHELRTPMTSVWGFSKIIRRDFAKYLSLEISKHPPAQREQLANRIKRNMEIIAKEGERLTCMVNDLLDLARIESGTIHWQNSLLDIGAVVRRTAEAASDIFKKYPKVHFSQTVSPDLPLVMADPERLQQVLMNLISNAVKFTPKGSVTLAATKEGENKVRFSVQDTGIGISEQELDRLTTPFYQAIHGSSLENKPPGTGLGLSICHGILEHYGSYLQIKSDKGVGSVFFFDLSVPSPAQPSAQSSAPPVASPGD